MISSNLNPLRWLVLPLVLAATLGTARAADFLDPEQAFRVTLAAAGERSQNQHQDQTHVQKYLTHIYLLIDHSFSLICSSSVTV